MTRDDQWAKTANERSEFVKKQQAERDARPQKRVRYDRAVAAYREIRREQERVAELADAAFLRWFEKREAGEKTNGGAAVRLANRENYLSAETYSAEAEVFAAGEALGIEDFDLDAIYLKEEG